MFICIHCHKEVSDYPIGTKQRNHCPFCLWSLHLDKKLPGDRKSICHGLMKPIGLTSKNDRATDNLGELMIVHQCEKCGIFSKNRIAGDDDPYQLLELLNYRNPKSPWPLLNKENESEAKTQLFGKSTNTK